MKQVLLFLGLVAVVAALKAPAYLGRDPDKVCLDFYSDGSATFWCVPETKPANCTDEAVFKAHQEDTEMTKCKDHKTR